VPRKESSRSVIIGRGTKKVLVLMEEVTEAELEENAEKNRL
jgi:hypothetical protein